MDDDLSVMLPDHKNINKSLDFLQNRNFSGKVIVWLSLNSARYTTTDLIEASQHLKQSLKGPLIAKVSNGLAQVDFMDKAIHLSKYTGQIIRPNKLSDIEDKINSKNIKNKLEGIYRQALAPVSAFTMPFLRIDPLGINQNLLLRLQKLSQNLGYQISLQKGHFLSTDGKHTMLVIDTPIEITDTKGADRLIKYIKKKVDVLPDFISGHIIAAHRHTISNERIIKRDIWLTASIAIFGFLLIFLFYFGDPKAIFVFILPLASIVVAISLSSFVFDKISYFIIGMGVVVAGIAIDYGIHVYVAVRSNHSVKKIIKPIAIGALTTISVFIAFLFSKTRGYNQLGFFSILSILLCLFYALFLLPSLLGKNKNSNLFNIKIFKGPARLSLFCWLLFILFVSFFIPKFSFDNDIKHFDGSSDEIIKSEKKFNQVWRSEPEPAIFVTESDNLEKLRQVNDAIYAKAIKNIGNQFVSFSAIWPSQAVRRYRYTKWKNFWKNNNEQKLKEIIAKQAPVYNFSKNIFKPFFDNLYTSEISKEIPQEISFLKKIEQKFLFKNENKYKMISFFPDSKENLEQLSVLANDYPQSFIVSRRALSRDISKAVTKEAIFLSIVSGSLIILLTFLLLGSLRLALLSLIVPITSILAILAIPGATAQPFNAPAIIAAIVVIGLSIDYGIFMVYNIHYKIKAKTPLAVTLSALTTLVGAGVLLFAKHPILFSIGLVLVVGVLSGYLTAFFVIPSLFKLFFYKKEIA